MRKISVLIALLVVISAVLISAGCVSEPQNPAPSGEKYIVGIDDFAPWTYKDDKGELTGFDIDAAKWVAKNQGFDLEFRFIDWDNMTSLLNDGSVDIVWSGLSITPERKAKIAFTQSYWNEPVGLAVRKNTYLKISDLYSGKHSIGIQKGCSSDLRLAEYIGSDPYQKLQDAGKIKNSYATFADSMQALSAGEVDFVVFDTSGIKDYIKTDSSLEYLGNIDETGEEYAAAVKTGNTELLAKLDAGIAALKKSGDLQYIQIKYGFAKAVAHTH